MPNTTARAATSAAATTCLPLAAPRDMLRGRCSAVVGSAGACRTHRRKPPALQPFIQSEREAHGKDCQGKRLAHHGGIRTQQRGADNLKHIVILFRRFTVETTDETDYSCIKRDNVYVDFTSTLNDEKVYGNEYFLAEATRREGVSHIEGTAQGIIAQTVKTPEMRLLNDFSRLFTLGDNTLTVRSTADFHYAPFSLNVERHYGRTEKSALAYRQQR